MRPLGMTERALWLLDQVGSFNLVLVAKTSARIEPRVLRRSLDLLQQRHPALRVRIETNGKPVFVSDGVPSIPLRLAEETHGNVWRLEAERELNQAVEWTGGPLARAVLLARPFGTDVLLTFSHVIGDGTSGVYMMRDLIRIAGNLIQRGIAVEESLAERPALDDLLPSSSRSLSGFLRAANSIGRQLPVIAVGRPQRLPSDSNAAPGERHTGIVHRSLEPWETQTLTESCRRERTTVHGALCSAMLEVTGEHIRANSGERGPVMIGCVTPINVRHLLDPPVGEDVGLFVSTAVTFHRVGSNAGFWELARRVRKSLRPAVERGEPFTSLPLQRTLLPPNATPSDAHRRARQFFPAAVGVTNLGRLDVPFEFGPISIEELHFACAGNATVWNTFTVAAATYRDRLQLNFLHAEPLLVRGRARSMADAVMERLRQGAGKRRSPYMRSGAETPISPKTFART